MDKRVNMGYSLSLKVQMGKLKKLAKMKIS